MTIATPIVVAALVVALLLAVLALTQCVRANRAEHEARLLRRKLVDATYGSRLPVGRPLDAQNRPVGVG